jgi:hypothetical protein
MSTLVGGSFGDYDLFSSFESQLIEQIKVRSKMKAVLGKDPGLKPGEADVKKWFKKLRGKSNTDVIDAYTSLAEGFFIHRVEANPDIVSAKQTLSSIFALPTTISNSRLIVCSGYAILGKNLLERSGAKFKEYIIRIHASNEQVKCGTTYDDVHAVAHLRRFDRDTKRTDSLYVSNDLIVPNKNAAIGSGAVAWAKATNPHYEGSGRTMASATKKAMNKIAKKKKSIKNITCIP